MMSIVCLAICLAPLTAERPRPPVLKERAWVQIPMDAFVLEVYQKTGRTPRSEPETAELVRGACRAIFGRDATEDEVKSVVGSRDKRAYEKLIDHWIDSAEFGVRHAAAAKELKSFDRQRTAAIVEQTWITMVGRLGDEHRAALDWLTWETIDPTLANCCELDRIPAAFDVKHLIRTLAVSATFRTRDVASSSK